MQPENNANEEGIQDINGELERSINAIRANPNTHRENIEMFLNAGSDIKKAHIRDIESAKQQLEGKEAEMNRDIKDIETKYNAALNAIVKLESIELRLPFYSRDVSSSEGKFAIDKNLNSQFLENAEVDYINNLYEDLKSELLPTNHEPSSLWDNFEIGFGEKIDRLKFWFQEKKYALESQYTKALYYRRNIWSEIFFNDKVKFFYNHLEYGNDLMVNPNSIQTEDEMLNKLLKLDLRQISVKLSNNRFQWLFDINDIPAAERRMQGPFASEAEKKTAFKALLIEAYHALEENFEIQNNVPGFEIGNIVLHNFYFSTKLASRGYFNKYNIFLNTDLSDKVNSEITAIEREKIPRINDALEDPNMQEEAIIALRQIRGQLYTEIDLGRRLQERVMEIRNHYNEINQSIEKLKEIQSLFAMRSTAEAAIEVRMRAFEDIKQSIEKKIENSETEEEKVLRQAELLMHNEKYDIVKAENNKVKTDILNKKKEIIEEMRVLQAKIAAVPTQDFNVYSEELITDTYNVEQVIDEAESVLIQEGHIELVEELRLLEDYGISPFGSKARACVSNLMFKNRLMRHYFDVGMERDLYFENLLNLQRAEKDVIERFPIADKTSTLYDKLQNGNSIETGEYGIEIFRNGVLKENYKFIKFAREYSGKIENHLHKLVSVGIITKEQAIDFKTKLQNPKFDMDLDYDINQDFKLLKGDLQKSELLGKQIMTDLELKCKGNSEAEKLHKDLNDAFINKLKLQNNKIKNDELFYSLHKELIDIITQKRLLDDKMITDRMNFVTGNNALLRQDIFLPTPLELPSSSDIISEEQVRALEDRSKILASNSKIRTKDRENIRMTDIFEPSMLGMEENVEQKELNEAEHIASVQPSCGGLSGAIKPRTKRSANGALGKNCIEEVTFNEKEKGESGKFIKETYSQSSEKVSTTIMENSIEENKQGIPFVKSNNPFKAGNNALNVYFNIQLLNAFLSQTSNGNFEEAGKTSASLFTPIAIHTASGLLEHKFSRVAKILPIVGNAPNLLFSIEALNRATTTEEKVVGGINIGIAGGFVALDVIGVLGFETGPAGLILGIATIGINEGDQIYHAYVNMKDIVKEMNLSGYEKFQETMNLYWNEENTKKVQNNLKFEEFEIRQLEYQLSQLLQDPEFKQRFDTALLSLQSSAILVREKSWVHKQNAGFFESVDKNFPDKLFFKESKKSETFLINQQAEQRVETKTLYINGIKVVKPNGQIIQGEAQYKAPLGKGRDGVYRGYETTNMERKGVSFGAVCQNRNPFVKTSDQGNIMTEAYINPNNTNIFVNYVGGQPLQKYEETELKGDVVIHSDTKARCEVSVSAQKLSVTTNAAQGKIYNSGITTSNTVVMENKEKETIKLKITPNFSSFASSRNTEDIFGLINIQNIKGPFCSVEAYVKNSALSNKNLRELQLRGANNTINILGETSQSQVFYLNKESRVTNFNPSAVFFIPANCGKIIINEKVLLLQTIKISKTNLVTFF